MKYLLIATSIALAFALQPANAADQGTAYPEAKRSETIHPPTNRVGEAVPTMKAEPSDNTAASQGAAGENKAETMHPPTNRVGQAVPTMKSVENKDDQERSTTYFYGDDQESSN